MTLGNKIFRIDLKAAEDEPTNWYVATSRDLAGLVTQGKGIDDTIANVKDAIRAYFDGHPPHHLLEVRIVVQDIDAQPVK